MPTETISTRPVEALTEPQYTDKSFELVFSKFCNKYEESLDALTGRSAKDGSDNRFMGLPADVSVQQMGRQLNEVAKIMGEPPSWEEEHQDGALMRDTILLSARYLAWHATLGGITGQYVDRLNDHINSEWHKGTNGGGSHQNLARLQYDRERAVSILLAQNHGLRDYFDSGLAQILGNDSPEMISGLLKHVPYSSEAYKQGIVNGLSLEIASKRHVEELQLRVNKHEGTQVAYGSDDQDARGGDLVVLGGDEILFIDVKSSMPEVFPGGERATPEDYERGYKWLDSEGEERRVIVWAFQDKPVEPGRFQLTDARFANNLERVVNSVNI